MSIQSATGVREVDLPWVDIGVRPGYNQRYHGFFNKQRKVAARIGSLYAEPIFHSPRHRHTFQQIRYVMSGKMKYGNETYEKGDCLYIPEGTYYGPVKPVENGEQLRINPSEIREKYAEISAKSQHELEMKCGRYNIDYVRADINEGFEGIILPYLLKRKKLH